MTGQKKGGRQIGRPWFRGSLMWKSLTITGLENTHSSTFSVHSLPLQRSRSQHWVMQPEETIKLSSDYSTSQFPPRLVVPHSNLSLSTSRRNTSHMTHLSLYLCPEYLCGHVTGQKGQHCFPHHPFQFPTPPALPLLCPLQPPGPKSDCNPLGGGNHWRALIPNTCCC